MSFSVSATTFQSPNGVTEECRALPHIAAGKYDIEDGEDEQKLCAIDFYAQNQIALCPKTWSTSPGTMVYDISKSNKSQADYEAQASCGGSKAGHEKITKFKQTMNASGTSGTFAPASLLYYHFSRYFDATIKVPVTVYRSMDKEAHFSRVTNKAHTKNMGKGAMNKAGWKALYNAEKNPASYRPASELFTADQKQIYGMLGDQGGERYGAEINGIRSRWGDAQNLDFQETPGFLALRSEKPLDEAIAEGLAKGMKNAKIRQAMGPGASKFQMAVWMKELSEIALLDHMFSQQDRIGNIDFKWYVYYSDDKGKVKSDKLDAETPRANMARIDYPRKGQPGVELVQRTRLTDNDAGVKENYTNFTKRTKMLEKIRHLAPETYKKLIDLDKDLQAGGFGLAYIKDNFGLNDAQVKKIVENTHEAAQIFRATCNAGKLKFDLASVKAAFKGGIQPVTLNCDNP
jgi:hypothetical protein